MVVAADPMTLLAIREQKMGGSTPVCLSVVALFGPLFEDGPKILLTFFSRKIFSLSSLREESGTSSELDFGLVAFSTEKIIYLYTFI
jgi:hypothetical protein